MPEDDDYLEFAHALADAARKIILAGLEPGAYETKRDHTPVTEIDLAVETRLRAMISERHPGHGFLGEETERERLDAELVWVIDPIDGTKAFLAGVPVFSTLISLARGGRPFLGLMDFPAAGFRVSGLAGRPTLKNGRERRCRTAPAGFVMAVSNPEALSAEERRRVKRLRAEAGFCVYGGSSLVYASVALGRVDLCLDGGLDVYDYCPLGPIVGGAGGRATDWEGRELTIGSGSRLLVTGDPALHERALEILGSPLEGPDGPPW